MQILQFGFELLKCNFFLLNQAIAVILIKDITDVFQEYLHSSNFHYFLYYQNKSQNKWKKNTFLFYKFCDIFDE